LIVPHLNKSESFTPNLSRIKSNVWNSYYDGTLLLFYFLTCIMIKNAIYFDIKFFIFSTSLFLVSDPTPIHALERLFFSLFGLTRPEDLKMTSRIGDWTLELFKCVFALYLLVTAIVLINLLIAMMSDTYQRIQVR